MATYKNRQVHILQELPYGEDAQVLIEHTELPNHREVVAKSAVTLNKDEKAAIDKQRDERRRIDETNLNDFAVEGEEPARPAVLPNYKEVQIQRAAEDNLVRAEDQRKEQEEWNKAHPNAPTGAFTQLESVKVVPYREETEANLKTRDQATKAGTTPAKR